MPEDEAPIGSGISNQQPAGVSSPDLIQSSTDKKSFGKDVGKLVTGTVIAQIIGVCLTPIITRIFSPEIYGVAAVFTSLVSIITVIVCLRYEMAILLPKDNKDAGAVLLLCFISIFLVSFITFWVMFFFGDAIAGLMGNSDVRYYLYLIPLAVFIDGLYLALRYWNTRWRRFGTQSATQVLQSLCGSGLKLGFGFGGFVSPGALIVTGMIGNALGTVVLMAQAIRSDFQIIKESYSLKKIFGMAKRYKKFPLVDLWSSLTNTISWQLPVLMITGFFSSAVAGLYSLCFTAMQMPLSLIGSSIGQVFFQRAATAKQNGTLSKLVEEIVSLLFILLSLPFLLVLIIGPELFSIFFGNNWNEAGIFAQILAVWMIFWFITSTTSALVYILEIQGIGLIGSVLNLITRVVAFLVGGLCGNIYLALLLFGIFGTIINIGAFYIWLRKATVSIRKIVLNIYKYLLVSILLTLIILILKILHIPSLFLCGVAVIIGIVYMIIIYKKNYLLKEYLLPKKSN